MNKAPSKKTCLKMAEIYDSGFMSSSRSCWYFLLAWANYQHFVKHEWPYISGMLKK